VADSYGMPKPLWTFFRLSGMKAARRGHFGKVSAMARARWMSRGASHREEGDPEAALKAPPGWSKR